MSNNVWIPNLVVRNEQEARDIMFRRGYVHVSSVVSYHDLENFSNRFHFGTDYQGRLICVEESKKFYKQPASE